MSAEDELGRLEREIDAKSAGDLKQSAPGKGKQPGSGGEKRRVSIGVEAIVGRRYQLMDCVTNGLDSAAAYQVIKTARVLADIGVTCSIATVRQPSPELLHLFHEVYLLSRGNCIYFGPTSQVEKYFSSLGYARPLSKALAVFVSLCLRSQASAAFAKACCIPEGVLHSRGSARCRGHVLYL